MVPYRDCYLSVRSEKPRQHWSVNLFFELLTAVLYKSKKGLRDVMLSLPDRMMLKRGCTLDASYVVCREETKGLTSLSSTT